MRNRTNAWDFSYAWDRREVTLKSVGPTRNAWDLATMRTVLTSYTILSLPYTVRHRNKPHVGQQTTVLLICAENDFGGIRRE